MDNRTILIGLHELGGIGWKSIRKIVRHTATLHTIFQMSSVDLVKIEITLPRAEQICAELSESFITEVLMAYEAAGVQIITYFDEQYPSLLKQTSQPPWVLYGIGDLDLLSKPMISVVGTRTPTVYGKRVAEDLSYQLSRSGFCIVSGLARGIDSEAHKGALRGEGGTVAVLGAGIDVVYPQENMSLYKEISTNGGLILSEFPLGIRPQPGLFPLRNRIIAGLALGTVVVEAALRSGSLITADQSLNESRDVFAVPGPITSPKSQGALALLKQGAKIVTCAEDIMEEYRHMIALSRTISYDASTVARPPLTEEEQFILRFLSDEPETIDALLDQSKYDFGHLHSVLLSLILKKQIEQLPGSAYVINY